MKNSTWSRKKIGLIMGLIFSVFILYGCYEGYVGSDGSSLRQYITTSSLFDLTENPEEDIWIIDVRPATAYNQGRIPTAFSYPSTEIQSRLDELPLDQYLILYCESGVRAQTVIKALEKEGYTRLMNWGGIARWPYELEQ